MARPVTTRILTREGLVDFPGYRTSTPGLVVTPKACTDPYGKCVPNDSRKRRCYQITHEPSGMSIGGYQWDRLADALKAAAAMSEIMDWTLPTEAKSAPEWQDAIDRVRPIYEATINPRSR